ncbi:MAG: DUF308 domain-containing protein, partial [Roseiflexaceae bacterium]|nr:DUF308 domain-containing protein [Roseiflexaceae bacterium]
VLGFIADAVFEGVYALIRRPPGWIWLVLLALLSVVLGVFIIANPSLLLLLIELLVGISLVVRGVLLLLLALEARALSR